MDSNFVLNNKNTFFVLDDTIIRELEQRNTVLLPNLNKMVISSQQLAYTSLFLTPEVRDVNLLMLPTTIASLTNLTLDIPTRAPRLKTLKLTQSTRWNSAQISLVRHALNELLENVNLESFYCDWFELTDKMTMSLLRMPALDSITMRKEVEHLVTLLQTRHRCKPLIKSFDLWTDSLSPELIPLLIPLLCPRKLTKFRIAPTSGRSNQKQLAEFLLTISGECSPYYLSELSLEAALTGNSNAANATFPFAIIDYALLKPLFCFSKMRKLSINDHPIILTDEEVKELAMAWPELESFDYQVDQTVVKPKTTLKGLWYLTLYCRKLENLTFAFDSRTKIDDTASGDEGKTPINPPSALTQAELDQVANHKLSVITVGSSRIDNAEEIGQFLNVVFPNLSLLFWTHAKDSPDALLWTAVQSVLRQGSGVAE